MEYLKINIGYANEQRYSFAGNKDVLKKYIINENTFKNFTKLEFLYWNIKIPLFNQHNQYVSDQRFNMLNKIDILSFKNLPKLITLYINIRFCNDKNNCIGKCNYNPNSNNLYDCECIWRLDFTSDPKIANIIFNLLPNLQLFNNYEPSNLNLAKRITEINKQILKNNKYYDENKINEMIDYKINDIKDVFNNKIQSIFKSNDESIKELYYEIQNIKNIFDSVKDFNKKLIDIKDVQNLYNVQFDNIKTLLDNRLLEINTKIYNIENKNSDKLYHLRVFIKYLQNILYNHMFKHINLCNICILIGFCIYVYFIYECYLLICK